MKTKRANDTKKFFFAMHDEIGYFESRMGRTTARAFAAEYKPAEMEAAVTNEPRYLEIRERGKRTVVGFRQTDTWDFQFLAHCEDELDHLIEHQAFEVLAFDLQGIDRLSSLLIGIFVTLRRSGFTIELLNPSAEVVDVLETMHLDEMIAPEHRLSSKDTLAGTDGPTEVS